MAGAHVDQEDQTATALVRFVKYTWIKVEDLHNGQNLEKVVLGKVLVGVVRMKLVESAGIQNKKGN